MTLDDVWDIIDVHKMKNVVNDVWTDGTIISISVRTPRTVEYFEQLFADSDTEIMVSL